MVKVRWVDDVYAPFEWTIRIRGVKPWRLAEMTPELIRRAMKITGKDVFEHDIRYDVSVEPRTFYGFWEGRRSEDFWTRTIIRVTV